MDILNGLNDEQIQALLQTEGAVLVTAGAGSGKTKLLTHRIAYLIENKKISSDRIIAITFTNKAANEMKQRVNKLVGDNNNVWISTFHSMCVKILRRHIDNLEGYDKNFSIYSDTDMEKTLKIILKEFSIAETDIKKYSYHISNCKNQNKTIEQYVTQLFGEDVELIKKIYYAYQNKLKSCNALDFDDLINKTYELLLNCPNVLNYYAEKFLYVLVDEIQDTNKIQYDLIKLLSIKHKNIFAVGDEDQCIYTWRGANFKNIFDFKNEFPIYHFYKLEQNYRSTKSILDKANILISNNTERFEKNLWTNNQQGKPVEFYEQYDEQSEAESIASKIIALKNNGYSYSDMAILMRVNALSLSFEQKLLAYNIPHRIYGGFRFYERAEIKNVIAYLRLFINPKDDISLLRIINFPKRAIGESAISKISEIANENNCSLLESLIILNNNPQMNSALNAKTKSFVDTYLSLSEQLYNVKLDVFVERVIQNFGIKTAYVESKEEDEEKVLNLDSFVNSVQIFQEQNENLSLGEYLESITLESDIDHMDETDQVTIATIHAVKGLEFKIVFVVGLEEGIFPLSRAMNSKSQLEEERRLMYVAMTRAEERLFISCANTRYMYGKRSYTSVSRFINEAELSIKRKPKEDNYYNYDYSNEYSCSNSFKPVPGYGLNNNLNNNYNNNGFNFIKPNVSNVNLKDLLNNQEDEIKKVNISKYRAGQIVTHPKFGKGTIKNIVDDGMCGEIEFEGLGVKTLMLNIAPLTILQE